MKVGLRRFYTIGLVALVSLTAACGISGSDRDRMPASIHLALGNPSQAQASPVGSAENYLLIKPQYVLSYNRSQNRPNWVSWQLDRSWLGEVPRSDRWQPDPDLPQGWDAVKPSDYNGSGYDRGHLIPAADRTKNVDDNAATFLMTNILPQAADNNRGPWEKLEAYSRDLVKKGKQLYIVAGGTGQRRSVGRSKLKIAVPESIWKVVVVLDRPGQGVTDVRASTRVIAVNIPNEQGIKDADWRTFRVSVDEIESKTGYDLLSSVPELIQQQIEARVDRQ